MTQTQLSLNDLPLPSTAEEFIRPPRLVRPPIIDADRQMTGVLAAEQMFRPPNEARLRGMV